MTIVIHLTGDTSILTRTITQSTNTLTFQQFTFQLKKSCLISALTMISTDNLIKQSKHNHFTSNIETAGNNPKKTWKLINVLTSRKQNRLAINLDNNNVITDAFNLPFTTVGENLANNISESKVNPT